MESIPDDELIESDGGFIRLTYARPWPRYVVSWSIRRRRGDTDFPVAAGEVEAGPGATDPGGIWSQLREQALQAVEQARAGSGPGAKTSWLGKLLGRR